jgi:hypothetical protein
VEYGENIDGRGCRPLVEYGETPLLPHVERGEKFLGWGGMRRKTCGTLRKNFGQNVERGEKSLGSRTALHVR